MLSPGEIIGVWIAAGLTLMMFSFIYRDNVFFKFGEHLYLGLSIGYYINVQYWQLMYPEVIRRLTIDQNYLILVPVMLGIFVLLRLVPQLAWLSRWAFAFYIGGAAGFAIPNVMHNYLMVQTSATMRPFTAGIAGNINQAVILIGVLSVLTFFFFSVEHRKFVGGVSKVGLYFLMIGFGAAFGATVMGRVSLLIGRFQFLVEDWFIGIVMRTMFGAGA